MTGDIWGYDITLFNVFYEEEILIEPEREIMIEESIPPINDVIYVRCNIKKTSLVLENIFKQINISKNINNKMNLISNNNMNKKNIIENVSQNNNINNEIKFNNYIIAEIDIKDEDVNENIKILGSYEEFFRANPGKLLEDNIFKNEDEIKKCEIKINNEIIPFNYYHKFKSKGKYTIKYSFKNNLKCTCLMFGDCKLLTNINLSNFNTNNVTNMNSMFYGCSSLKDINLSNFNTNNVTSCY